MAASSTAHGDAPPQSTTQRIYTTIGSAIHTALIYISPLIPLQYQEEVKQAYKARPYLSTFLTVQLILLLLPLTILASVLFTLSFVLVVLGLVTFLFWGGILLLSSIPILLFTLVIGSFIWGWGAAAYTVYVFAGMGKDMVLGESAKEKGTVQAMKEALREKVGAVRQEVEAEMGARYGTVNEKATYNGGKPIKREDGLNEVSLPALAAGKEGPGKVAGTQDHVPGKKEAGFETEEEMYEPEDSEPITLANGGDDVMRSISRSLS